MSKWFTLLARCPHHPSSPRSNAFMATSIQIIVFSLLYMPQTRTLGAIVRPNAQRDKSGDPTTPPWLQGVETVSHVWFTDLAAGERATAAGPTAAGHLRELQAAKRSLSALADCVEARCLGHKHIPYRNSNLTHLLQVCLMHTERCCWLSELCASTPHAWRPLWRRLSYQTG